MNAPLPVRVEHREDPRIPTATAAKVKAPGIVLPVVIQESSACGLRLSSPMPLHRNERLALQLPGEPAPLHATVVWVHAGLGKPRTWTAGCRLLGDSVGRAHLPAAWEATPGPEHHPGRAALVAVGLVGALALLAYLFLKVATLLGGSPQLLRPP